MGSKEAGERGAGSRGEDWKELVLPPIENALEGRGLIPMFRSASRLRDRDCSPC